MMAIIKSEEHGEMTEESEQRLKGLVGQKDQHTHGVPEEKRAE